MAEAKNHADTYHRHGKAESSEWKEAQAVTGREVDKAPENSSFASRAKRGAADNKQVAEAEGKDEDASKSETKKRKPAAKKSDD